MWVISGINQLVEVCQRYFFKSVRENGIFGGFFFLSPFCPICHFEIHRMYNKRLFCLNTLKSYLCVTCECSSLKTSTLLHSQLKKINNTTQPASRNTTAYYLDSPNNRVKIYNEVGYESKSIFYNNSYKHAKPEHSLFHSNLLVMP